MKFIVTILSILLLSCSSLAAQDTFSSRWGGHGHKSHKSNKWGCKPHRRCGKCWRCKPRHNPPGDKCKPGAEPVPEPMTMALFGTGAVGLALYNRRKNKKSAQEQIV